MKLKSELIIDFNNKLQELAIAEKGTSVVNTPVPTLDQLYIKYDEAKFLAILKMQLERPAFSERERFLLKLVEEKNACEIHSRMEIFSKDETAFCPYCLQPLSSEYKMDLVKSMEKILSKEVEDHVEQLKEMILKPLVINLEFFKEIAGYDTCLDLINKLNSSISFINEQLTHKINNPYSPIQIESINFHELVKKLKISLDQLESERIQFNEKAKDTKQIIAALHQINNEITHYDIEDLVCELNRQKKKFNNHKKIYDELEREYCEKKKILENLEAQKKNVFIALNTINGYMSYIFFDKNRLKIEFEDGVYKLRSRGNSVKPCEVSVGERNIIGLSYFFANILEGKEEEKAYEKEHLIVIDDPVSSYDLENRIGVISFLRYVFNIFLSGNHNTKLLIMTHDLRAFYDMQKIFKDIKDDSNSLKFSWNSLEITHESVVQFSFTARHEYTELLKAIWDYALENEEDSTTELVIGNVMRQALEMFATFQYKKGIEKVSTDEEILQLLPDASYKTYYQNLMYRLILHGGSHQEEQIKSMNDFPFFQYLSKEEKPKTARDILCFIYLLNKPQLLCHLKGYKSFNESIMDDWCENIKNNTIIL